MNSKKKFSKSLFAISVIGLIVLLASSAEANHESAINTAALHAVVFH